MSFARPDHRAAGDRACSTVAEPAPYAGFAPNRGGAVPAGAATFPGVETMVPRTAVTVALVAALVLAGCGGDAEPSDDGGAESPAAGSSEMDGRSFVSTSVTGAALVESTKIQLTFEDQNLSATAGCNTLTGAYQLEDGTLSWTSRPAQTFLRCDDQLSAQDAWLSALLVAGVETSEEADGLVLEARQIRIELEEVSVAAPATSLFGTVWVLESYRTAQGSTTVGRQREPATLTIAPHGLVLVTTGCNNGSGSVEKEPATLTFTPLRTTRRACAGADAEVEAAVLATLDGELDYALDGDRLTLDQGDRGLVYRAEGPAASAG
jgi:heat shock protein HslJ